MDDNINDIFCYVFVFIMITYIILRYNVKLGIIICMIFIYYLYMKKKNEKEEKYRENIEKSLIISNMEIKDEEMIDFLVEIQDFYMYNPQVYKEMYENINEFFKIKNEIENDNELIGLKYSLIELRKKNILNLYHSIVFSIPSEEKYNVKYRNGLNILNNILNNYLKNIINLNKKYISKNNYNRNTYLIYNGEKPYNFYNEYDYV